MLDTKKTWVETTAAAPIDTNALVVKMVETVLKFKVGAGDYKDWTLENAIQYNSGYPSKPHYNAAYDDNGRNFSGRDNVANADLASDYKLKLEIAEQKYATNYQRVRSACAAFLICNITPTKEDGLNAVSDILEGRLFEKGLRMDPHTLTGDPVDKPILTKRLNALKEELREVIQPELKKAGIGTEVAAR